MRDVATLLRMGQQLAIRKWRQSPFGPKSTFDGELAKAGLDFRRWHAARRASRRQFVEIDDAAVARLGTLLPGIAKRTIASAEKALAHEFDLLGSGPYRAVDPDREPSPRGYLPIDWALDPVRNARFRNDLPYKEWKLFEMRPRDADIKFPWELARCQQFAPLGQAWRLTGEAHYAHEILDQIDDFTEANPVGVGVNWTCTMDVGLRAANWALGLALVKDCAAIPEARWRDAYAALFEHGRFIFANFENTYEVTSNHYLSNVVGLYFIAAEFPELDSGRRWDAYSAKSLETEIDVQILPDGADFESSVMYHRLVGELFIGGFRLAQLQGRPLSAHYAERLRDMIGYLVGVMRPDGLMPQYGDADDGRLFILTDWSGWQRADARHILGPAAHALGRPEWLEIGGEAAYWEAAWWGFPPGPGAAKPLAPKAPPDHVRLYPDAGAFVARQGGNYLLVTNAKVGTKGFGNHKHNDQLGFELMIAGHPVIVDPGNWVYTSDFAGRNRFRSTAAHSTLAIDGVEQNEFNPEWLFRMFEKADATHLAHGVDGVHAHYAGAHVGYRRLEAPVGHERQFRFDPGTAALAIEDRLDGSGSHDLAWTFQLAPGAGVVIDGAKAQCTWEASGLVVAIAWPEGLEAQVADSFVSPGYGARTAAPALRLSQRTDVAANSHFGFSIAAIALPRASRVAST